VDMLLSEAMLEDFQSRYHFLGCLGDEFGKCFSSSCFPAGLNIFQSTSFLLTPYQPFVTVVSLAQDSLPVKMVRRPFHFR
jgi:hypothetical protein